MEKMREVPFKSYTKVMIDLLLRFGMCVFDAENSSQFDCNDDSEDEDLLKPKH